MTREDPHRGIFLFSRIRDFIAWEEELQTRLYLAMYKGDAPRFAFVGVFAGASWFDVSTEATHVELHLEPARQCDLLRLREQSRAIGDIDLTTAIESTSHFPQLACDSIVNHATKEDKAN